MRRVALALTMFLFAAACGGGDDKTVTASESDATTTTAEMTTTTVPTTTTAAPKVTTTPRPVVAKEKKCVSATGANETEPENKPLRIEVCVDDVTPAPRQKVTLTVTADDPDAPIGDGDCDIYVSWQASAPTLCRDVLIPPGPDDPPRVAQHGHIVRSYDHVYSDKGQYTISVTVWSGPGDGRPDPYDNYATASLPVSVK